MQEGPGALWRLSRATQDTAVSFAGNSKQMFLAEAERASQLDKDKCKEGLLLSLRSKSLAGRKGREVLSHKLWARSRKEEEKKKKKKNTFPEFGP